MGVGGGDLRQHILKVISKNVIINAWLGVGLFGFSWWIGRTSGFFYHSCGPSYGMVDRDVINTG